MSTKKKKDTVAHIQVYREGPGEPIMYCRVMVEAGQKPKPQRKFKTLAFFPEADLGEFKTALPTSPDSPDLFA